MQLAIITQQITNMPAMLAFDLPQAARQLQALAAFHGDQCKHDDGQVARSADQPASASSVLGRSALHPSTKASVGKHRHGQEEEQQEQSSRGDSGDGSSSSHDLWLEGAEDPLDALEAAVSLTQVRSCPVCLQQCLPHLLAATSFPDVVFSRFAVNPIGLLSACSPLFQYACAHHHFHHCSPVHALLAAPRLNYWH
jgi:hypothetical protein